MQNNHHLVIMAGGSGKRLWPLSTEKKPKQFHPLGGGTKSSLQQTVARFTGVIPLENIWVITQNQYKSLVQDQLPFLHASQLLGEPIPKNTAPCIAYACYKITKKNPGASIVVTPADHFIKEAPIFQDMIQQGLQSVDNRLHDKLILLGATCTSPATGYGYIQLGRKRHSLLQPIIRFIEKPTYQQALEYMHTDNYLWNMGIIIGKVADFLKSYQHYLPTIAKAFSDNIKVLNTPQEASLINQCYQQFPTISFDKGILEKMDKLVALHYTSGWSDLGTWEALYNHAPHDKQGNVIDGNVEAISTQQCMIYNMTKSLIATYGVQDLIIVQNDDTTMICAKGEEES